MPSVRRVFQVFSLVIFFLLFFFATYPLTRIPVDFFLRADPLLGISASLAARSFILKTIPAFVLLCMTFFLGRFFCGWICPFGTTIDGMDSVSNAKSRNDRFLRFRWIKFNVLIIVIVTSLLSVQLVGLVDPIPLFTRTVVTFMYPLFVLFTDGLFRFFMSFAFLEETAFRIHEGLRGVLLPIHITTFQNSIVVALIFLAILNLTYVHKRFWCRNLCPLGALLGLFSKMRMYRRLVTEECTQCGLCRKNCRMDAIEPDFKSTNNIECISCMDCQKICPVNAIQFGFVKKPETTKVNLSRRRFLASGATGLLSLGILKIGFSNPKKNGYVIRPPGSLEEDKFLDRCVRCGECIRVCSTAGAGLQYGGFESGFTGIWTPILLPETGYCEYNCNMCGQVCPTGAIHPLTLEQKKEIKIGTAHFEKTRCIPWYYGENCMVCEEHCPLPDKAIKFRESNTIAMDGKESSVLLPYVDETLCIGCGICVTRCPVEGDRGIFVTRANEERWTG